jgi:thymidylate synthase (FAD)
MRVKLLRYTKDGIRLIADSCRVSGIPPELEDEEIVRMVVENDYTSVLEHISFTFDVSGISLALSRELLEHRIASHTARSTRYQEEGDFQYYVPRELEGNRDAMEHYRGAIEAQRKAYLILRSLGISRETRRYLLPMAAHTNYVLTMNARSLINFLGLRLCVRASPEMRELARKIHSIVKELYPAIFADIGCRGVNMAVCPENEVRESPQARQCPYRIRESRAYIPTKKEVREGGAEDKE